jgi:hypothetical protein
VFVRAYTCTERRHGVETAGFQEIARFLKTFGLDTGKNYTFPTQPPHIDLLTRASLMKFSKSQIDRHCEEGVFSPTKQSPYSVVKWLDHRRLWRQGAKRSP